jgi:hypothetical protein
MTVDSQMSRISTILDDPRTSSRAGMQLINFFRSQICWILAYLIIGYNIYRGMQICRPSPVAALNDRKLLQGYNTSGLLSGLNSSFGRIQTFLIGSTSTK